MSFEDGEKVKDLSDVGSKQTADPFDFENEDDMPYESEFVQLTSTPRKAERPSYMCFRNANLRTASFPKILVIFFIWRFLMLFLFFTKLTTSFTRLYLF